MVAKIQALWWKIPRCATYCEVLEGGRCNAVGYVRLFGRKWELWKMRCE